MTSLNYGLFEKRKEKESIQLARVVFKQIMCNILQDDSQENSYLKDIVNIIFNKKKIDEMTGIDIKQNIQRIVFIKQLVSDNDEFDLIPTIIQVMNDVVRKIGESKPSNSQFPRLAKTISFISPNITNMLHKLKKLESGRFEKLLKISNFMDEDKNINKLILDFKAPDRMKIILNALYCCLFTVGVHFALDFLLYGKEIEEDNDKKAEKITQPLDNYNYNWDSYNYNENDSNIINNNNTNDNDEKNDFVNHRKRKIDSDDDDNNNNVFSCILNKHRKTTREHNEEEEEGEMEREEEEGEEEKNRNDNHYHHQNDIVQQLLLLQGKEKEEEREKDIAAVRTTKSKEEEDIARNLIQDENIEIDNNNDNDEEDNDEEEEKVGGGGVGVRGNGRKGEGNGEIVSPYTDIFFQSEDNNNNNYNDNEDNDNDRNQIQEAILSTTEELDTTDYYYYRRRPLLANDAASAENLNPTENLNDDVPMIASFDEKEEKEGEGEEEGGEMILMRVDYEKEKNVKKGKIIASEKEKKTRPIMTVQHEKRMKKSSKRKKNFDKIARENKSQKKCDSLERVRSDPELYRANKKIILKRKRTKSFDF